MARAKLLRQYLSDYNRKLGKEQGAYEDRYAAYEGQYDQYAQQANAYNQAIEQFNANTRGLTPGDIYQGEGGNLLTIDKRGNTVNYTTPQYWGAQSSQPYKATDGLWYVDQDTTQRDESGQPAVTGYDWQTGEPIYAKVTTTPVYLPVKAFHPGTAPVAPATPAPPEEVRKPNLTQNDYKEIANPGQTQGQLAMQAARGYLGKSELAAENDPSSQNSAFTNLKGDDPNGLKAKGLVAQAIAGEI